MGWQRWRAQRAREDIWDEYGRCDGAGAGAGAGVVPKEQTEVTFGVLFLERSVRR